MPKVKGITYSLDGNREVYYPGDIVSGCWTLDLGEPFSVRGIRTALHGAVYTRWTPWEDFTLTSRKDDKISQEKITTQWNTVFGKKLGEDGPNPTIAAGIYQYRFSFQLPADRLPSSYEGSYGAIRYWLQLQIDRPLLKFNTDRHKMITVLDRIHVNIPEFSSPVERRTEKKISKALGLGDRGSVSLYARTDRGAYCPGEKIAVSLSANNDSEKDLGVVKASLIQVMKFVASDSEKTNEYVLRTAKGAPLLKKSKVNWNNQRILVDAVPPTTRERTSHIVMVSYFVKVTVEVPILQGGDISLYIPVTIGTIPQGHQSSANNTASNITELDLTSIITHTQCTIGFEFFDERCDDFPQENYIPWCTYVPNFQIKPKTHLMSGFQAGPARTDRSMPTALPVSHDQATRSKHLTRSDSKTAFVMLRFLKSHAQDFRSKLKDTRGNLDSMGGKIIAFSPEVTVIKGTWPVETSVAVFLFETKERGKQWFDVFYKNCKLSDLEVLDSVVGATKEAFQNEKRTFHLHLSFVSADLQSIEWKRYVNLACQQLVPLRQEKGGVLLTSTRLLNHVQGKWPEPKSTVFLYQWNSLSKINEYENSIDSNDKYKEVNELRRQLLPIATDILFETEELSFMDEALS